MDWANEIKDRLSMREVAERYGYQANRAGYISCPFHNEKTASLKVYDGNRGWHCFGCGRGGSVIDFAMELFNLDFRGACAHLNDEFRLGLSLEPRPLTTSEKHQVRERDRARKVEQARKNAEEKLEMELIREYRYWWQIRIWFAPESFVEDRQAAKAIPPGEAPYIHPMYAEAMMWLPYLEHRIDEIADRRWAAWRKPQQAAGM